MRRTLRLSGIGLALLVVLGPAAGASALLPSAGRIAAEVAGGNRRAGRDGGAVLAVALRGDGESTLARGELVSDPRGLARLELGSASGELERHLLRSGEYLAARGGTLVPASSPWLPPLFLLQAGSGERLLSALLSLGASPDEVVLGRHEGEVCYVLGGRDLPPPANASAARVGSPGPKAALWIERESSRIVRIDARDGTRFLLGPPRDHGGRTWPEWIRIERPGAPVRHLDILDVRGASFDPAVTFARDWLLAR